MMYADANYCIRMKQEVLDAYVKWLNVGDPINGSVRTAARAEAYLDKMRVSIGEALKIDPEAYLFIPTSSGEEANVLVCDIAIKNFFHNNGYPGTVMVSSLGHASAKKYVDAMTRFKMCKVARVPTDPETGTITRHCLDLHHNGTCCLVTVPGANAITGVMNDPRMIAEACAEYREQQRFPMLICHIDASHLYNYAAVTPEQWGGASAITICMRKIGGPPNIGMLIIKKEFVQHYRAKDFIPDRPIDIAALAGADKAMQLVQKKRAENIRAMVGNIKAFREIVDRHGVAPAIAAAPPRTILPNTACYAISGGYYDAKALKEKLEKRHQVVCRIESTPAVIKHLQRSGHFLISFSFEPEISRESITKCAECFVGLL